MPPPLVQLLDELKALDAEPLAGASGFDVCRRRTAAVDRALQGLAERAAAKDLAVAATGGYGRNELCPGSDIDLLILHRPGADEQAEAAAQTILYPLWDAGWKVGHAVRTPEECAHEGRRALGSLTAMLDMRMLAGPPELFRAAVRRTRRVVREDVQAFDHSLLEVGADRRAHWGVVAHSMEPDLKEALGGLRDWQRLGWLAVARGAGMKRRGPEARITERATAAADFLLLVRTALHRVTGGSSNRLTADHQAEVAGVLGIEGTQSWEPRDELMRRVYGHGRRLMYATVDAQGWLTPAAHPTRARPAPARGASGLRILLTELSRPGTGFHELERWEAEGHLAACIEGWADVAGRPQRDPYHRYPVDVHLIAAGWEAARILQQQHEPFLEAAVRTFDHTARDAVLLGALLHDIGKVGRGSHVELGTAIAEAALDGLEAGQEVRDDVLFLVREHLLLSDTATRRNIDDEDLVVQVAARIGHERRLAMLYVVTVADALATGPTASTPWRMGLLRELVARVSRVFEQGRMDPDQAGRLAEATGAVRRALAGLPGERAEAFVQAVPPSYLLWVRPEEAPDHLPLILPPPEGWEVRMNVRPGRSKETYRVAVGVADRLGVLASVAGALTVSGLSILRAQAFTTLPGIALDVFDVRGAFEADVDRERWDRFREALHGALDGEVDLAERVGAMRDRYPPPGSDIPVSVRVDQDASDFHTVVEVSAPDRMGLLFDLARGFASHGVDVHVAKVATYGHRVVNVFYVTEQAGGKLEGARLGEVSSALSQAGRGVT